MDFEMLARRLYVVTVVAFVLTSVMFIAGSYLHNDVLIYTGAVTTVFTAVAAVGSLALTAIEAVMWRQEEKRKNAQDS